MVVAKGKNLLSANIDTQIDLTGLAVHESQNFNKGPGRLFKINLKGKQFPLSKTSRSAEHTEGIR